MMEIISNNLIILGCILGGVIFLYGMIFNLLPEFIQFKKEEKLTIDERMELRKSRGEL